MNRTSATLCAALGLTGVALGALGAHAVKNLVNGADDAAQRLAWWETAARYHLFHALAFGLIAMVPVRGRSLAIAQAAWLAGIGLFCGSLYVMALTGNRVFAAVTPIGGVALLTGWTALIVAVRRLP